MVRRNSGRKGWKTLIRPAWRVGDDAAQDPCMQSPCRARHALKRRSRCTRMARSCRRHAFASVMLV
ncbi:hypothetical protein CN645_18810 [Burkholderia sp. IDO3]|nr:hypothetical protein DCN14_22900 [Burkholderia sp. IDO3]PCD60486.1 hypothetical protein CN645_18810 [Burkholderia sp. IDO3]